MKVPTPALIEDASLLLIAPAQRRSIPPVRYLWQPEAGVIQGQKGEEFWVLLISLFRRFYSECPFRPNFLGLLRRGVAPSQAAHLFISRLTIPSEDFVMR